MRSLPERHRNGAPGSQPGRHDLQETFREIKYMRFNSTAIERRTHSGEFIKAKAELDAFEYIRLMRKKSPESLELEPDGKLIIDTVAGRKIFEEVRKKLKTPEEMQEYVINLETAVRRILGK